MIKKIHGSTWLVMTGLILIMAGLLFVPADAVLISVPLRLAGNIFLGSGIIWAIVHFGRIK